MTDARIDRLEEQMLMVTRSINQNVGATRANTTAIAAKPDNSEMRAGFNEVMQWLGTLTTKQDQTQSDVDTLKGDASELKTDVSTLKGDVSTLKADIADIKTRLGSLEQGIQQILSLLQQR